MHAAAIAQHHRGLESRAASSADVREAAIEDRITKAARAAALAGAVSAVGVTAASIAPSSTSPCPRFRTGA
jgi:hypothetical protein